MATGLTTFSSYAALGLLAALAAYYLRQRRQLSLQRRVLLLKGLVFGIPQDKYDEALAKASEIIAAQAITTVAWDGDKFTYQGADGGAPAASFSRLLPLLQAKFPHLEFMFFKKAGQAAGLLEGGAIKADDYGNVLGPLPFLKPANTAILRDDGAPPGPPAAGQHYGVEMADVAKWYDLGLRGMKYLHSVCGVGALDVLVLGLGGVVHKENEKVAEAPAAYPARRMAIIDVQRK